MSEVKEVVFGEDIHSLRLDRALSLMLPEYSRTYLKELIDEGRAELDGKVIKASTKVEAGEKVTLRIPDPETPEILPQPMELSILYEDSDLLIVDKPKGLTVHPAPGHKDGTLVNGILAHCGGELSGINGVMRPGIVHRIDKDTSGALIICKNDSAHRSIARQLKEHSITRRYRGIVIGNLPGDDGTIEGNIGRNPYDRKKMSVVREGGKSAVTHYHVLKRFGGYTYCEFTLETGRTHQIRVHMASIGHPLAGDTVYGPARSAFSLEGQALHAMVIGFVHPSSGEYMSFEAPLPAYFTELLQKLEHTRGSVI